jgi:hypothetical protein
MKCQIEENVFCYRLTMSDRVQLTEADMTADGDAETGNRGRSSGNDDEQEAVSYSW